MKNMSTGRFDSDIARIVDRSYTDQKKDTTKTITKAEAVATVIGQYVISIEKVQPKPSASLRRNLMYLLDRAVAERVDIVVRSPALRYHRKRHSSRLQNGYLIKRNGVSIIALLDNMYDEEVEMKCNEQKRDGAGNNAHAQDLAQYLVRRRAIKPMPMPKPDDQDSAA